MRCPLGLSATSVARALCVLYVEPTKEHVFMYASPITPPGSLDHGAWESKGGTGVPLQPHRFTKLKKAESMDA